MPALVVQNNFSSNNMLVSFPFSLNSSNFILTTSARPIVYYLFNDSEIRDSVRTIPYMLKIQQCSLGAQPIQEESSVVVLLLVVAIEKWDVILLHVLVVPVSIN